MASSSCTEIVELNEEQTGAHSFSLSRLRVKVKSEEKRPMDEDLNSFLKGIDLKSSSRDVLRKNMYKMPINKPGPSQLSRIEITESVTLKQALRKLCISQASEMASMKRLTKPAGVSDPGSFKKLYASVVVQSSRALTDEKRNLVEVSIVPDKMRTPVVSKNKGEITQSCGLKSVGKSKSGNIRSISPARARSPKMRIQDVISEDPKDKKGKMVSKSSVVNSQTSTGPLSHFATPRLVKPVFRNKSTVKKVKPEPITPVPNSTKSHKPKCSSPVTTKDKPINQSKSIIPPLTSKKSTGVPMSIERPCEITSPKTIPIPSHCVAKLERKEKGECSQSSKSSMGDYSTSTSISEDSLGGSSAGSRPHMSKDNRWVAIRRAIVQNGPLGLDNFKLIKRLGCGDIGTVYLAELASSGCLFALKVMDVDFLISRKKMMRAQTEREILQMLDHPFLPTLYAHFTTDNLACLVMEFCPGGDLHVLRQKQPTRCFSEPAARYIIHNFKLCTQCIIHLFIYLILWMFI
jgi:Protein kinase domain